MNHLNTKLSVASAVIADGPIIKFNPQALGLSDVFVVRMPDDSMAGTIECGEPLLVEPVSQKRIWWDAIYFYEFEGHQYVRRLQLAGDKLIIICDNKHYQNRNLSDAEQLKVKIMGIVRYYCQIKLIG